MKELLLEIENKEELKLNEDIEIKAIVTGEKNIEYKFIEGYDKVWKPIQGFSEKNVCKWIPNKIGKHMILVQGRVKDSNKPYNYKSIIEIDVKEDVKQELDREIKEEMNEKVIEEVNEEIKVLKKVNIDNNKLNIGERSIITIESEEEALYRFCIRENDDWKVLREYSTEQEYIFTANEIGVKEILVEGKKISSTNNVDEYERLNIEVRDLSKIEIVDFKCLTREMLVDEIIDFVVDVNHSDNRPILYKYFKVDKSGRAICIQDFSSNSRLSFRETEAGKHKILCLVRDMFSNKEYDDRALITYEIKGYRDIKIKNFKADIVSPQTTETLINFKSEIEGGREVSYKYEIEGPICENTGYTRSPEYLWKPSVEGEYIIRLKAKDVSFSGEYEDSKVLYYKIDRKSEKPIRIIDIKCDKGRKCIVNEQLNIIVKSDGRSNALYSFLVYKDSELIEEIYYTKSNWLNFTPKEYGEYEIEARVKDIYSKKEYDSSASIYIKCRDYTEAEIDYILVNNKGIYLTNQLIKIEAIIQNTNDTLVRFITKINGMEVEDTGFVKSKAIKVYPKSQGKYTFEIYAKNIKSKREYDNKKQLIINVNDNSPITNTKITLSSEVIRVGEEAEFKVNSTGGKDTCYEFYMMKNGNWNLVQKYSKKDYYRFFPFDTGEYRILVLSRSFYKKEKYEDYDSIYFNAVES